MRVTSKFIITEHAQYYKIQQNEYKSMKTIVSNNQTSRK